MMLLKIEKKLAIMIKRLVHDIVNEREFFFWWRLILYPPFPKSLYTRFICSRQNINSMNLILAVCTSEKKLQRAWVMYFQKTQHRETAYYHCFKKSPVLYESTIFIQT